MKMLVVEDDQVIAEFVRKGFREQGFQVDHTANGEEALHMLTESGYDMVILDLMIPGIDGLTLLKHLRTSASSVPVIVLSALNTVADRVRGLEYGCDDYLVKPFSFVELQARVQALLRRPAERDESHELAMADLRLNRLTKTVTRANQVIRLQPRELALLEYLLLNPERVLSKTMILEQIWDYNFDPQTNVVDVLVCRLRSKIDKDQDIKLLHTLRGLGYVLRTEAS